MTATGQMVLSGHVSSQRPQSLLTRTPTFPSLRPAFIQIEHRSTRLAGLLPSLTAWLSTVSHGWEGVMNSGIRIVKRGGIDGLRNFPNVQDQKTERQSAREIVSTVKSWIAELELRKLSRRTEALPPVK